MAYNNTTDPGSFGTSEPFVGEHISLALRVVFVVIGSVMIVSGVVGNSTLIVIVVKNFMMNKRKNLHDLFIASLVLVDLLLMGYWFTFFILDLSLGYHPVVDGSHCTANAIILLGLYTVNLNSLVSISFNRYLHVCHSHLYPRVFTLPRTMCWCLIMWIFSFLLTLPPLWGGVAGFYFYNPKTHVCSYNREGITYLKVMVILYTVLPPAFISYFNVAIFRHWKKARMSLSERYPLGNKVQKKKKNLIAKLRARKHDKKSGAARSSLEHEIQPESQPPELVSESSTVVHFNVGHERSQTLSESTEESNVPASVTNIEHNLYNANGDEASGTEMMTPSSRGTQAEVNDSDQGKSDSDSDDSHSSPPIKYFVSEDKPDNHQQDDSIISRTETDSRMCTELRDKTDILSQSVDVNDNTEETDIETIETTVTTDSSQRGSASVEALPTTTTSPSSASETPKRQSRSKRVKRQDQGTSAKSHQRRLRKKSRSQEEAFVRSLLVVCVLALVTFLPYTVVVIVDTYIKQPKEIHIAANLVIFINNSVNWIVYGAMNSAYKRGYVKYARQVFKKCRP